MHIRESGRKRRRFNQNRLRAACSFGKPLLHCVNANRSLLTDFNRHLHMLSKFQLRRTQQRQQVRGRWERKEVSFETTLNEFNWKRKFERTEDLNSSRFEFWNEIGNEKLLAIVESAQKLLYNERIPLFTISSFSSSFSRSSFLYLSSRVSLELKLEEVSVIEWGKLFCWL